MAANHRYNKMAAKRSGISINTIMDKTLIFGLFMVMVNLTSFVKYKNAATSTIKHGARNGL